MKVLKQTDPLILISAVLALFLGTGGDPWWRVFGATSDQLLTVDVSPFYLHTAATGISATVPFAEMLGSFSRILVLLTFLLLGLASLSPDAWWREIAVYFSLSVFVELYLSFFLLYHVAETGLLGAYGVLPPYIGTSELSTIIIGTDLNTYVRPLVNAGFTPSFYLGFLCLGFVGASQLVKSVREKRERRRPKGVAAIFTSDQNVS